LGIFSKFLKGLGFEEEEVPQKQEKVKKVKKQNNQKVTASYNLNSFEDELSKKETPKQIMEEKPEKEENNSSGNLEIVNVTSQNEVQKIVNKLKNGEKVLINMSGLSGNDLVRSLDFLTGAVYALDMSMQKIDGSVYIIQ